MAGTAGGAVSAAAHRRNATGPTTTKKTTDPSPAEQPWRSLAAGRLNHFAGRRPNAPDRRDHPGYWFNKQVGEKPHNPILKQPRSDG